MLMWLGKVCLVLLANLIFYVVLLYAAVRFYLWSRRQQKKYAMKWSRRVGVLGFFAPLLLWLTHALLDLPPQVMEVLNFLPNLTDHLLTWIHSILRPLLGWGYFLFKPTVAAFVYGAVGFVVGYPLDWLGQKDKK